MPTIIDQLIVTLSLDPRNFTAGQKAAVGSLQQTARQMQTMATGVRQSGNSVVSVLQGIQHPAALLHQTFTRLATTTAVYSPLQTNLAQVAAQGRRSGFGIQSGALAGASGLRILGIAGLGAFAAIETLRRGMNHAKEAAAGIFTAGVGASAAGMDIARFTAISQMLQTLRNVPQAQTQAWLSGMAQRQFVARTTGVGAEELATAAAYTRSGIAALSDTPEEMMRKMARSFAGLSEKEAVGRGGFLGLSPEQSLALREAGGNFTRFVEQAAEVTRKQQEAARGVTDASNRMGEAFDKLTRIIDEELAPVFVNLYDFITKILNILTGNVQSQIDPRETTGKHGAFVEGIKRGWNWLQGKEPVASAPISPTPTPGAPGRTGALWDPAKSGFTDPGIAAGAAIVRSSEGSTRDVNNFMYDRPGTRRMGPDGVDTGFTAGGYYQTLDSNWVRVARRLGIDTKEYPRAHGSPQALQDRVHEQMVKDDIARGGSGYSDWSTRAGGPINALRLAQIQFAAARARVAGPKLSTREADSQPPPTMPSEANGQVPRAPLATREASRSSALPDGQIPGYPRITSRADLDYIRASRAREAVRPPSITTNNNAGVTVGDVHVSTQATDPMMVGQAVSSAIKRMVSQANTGLDY